MKRDVVITVLLVIAGIILAIVLFGAGVFWRGKTSPARSSQTVPARHQDHVSAPVQKSPPLAW